MPRRQGSYEVRFYWCLFDLFAFGLWASLHMGQCHRLLIVLQQHEPERDGLPPRFRKLLLVQQDGFVVLLSPRKRSASHHHDQDDDYHRLANFDREPLQHLRHNGRVRAEP